MTKATFDITSFGAKGDGKTINTDACRAAACACRDNGGGTILVPCGDFVTGIFQLFSGTTLQVEKGGRLLASPDRDDRQVGSASGGLLYALDAHDIVLTGEGILDGNGDSFFSTNEVVPWPAGYGISETRQARLGKPYGSQDFSHGPMRPLGRPGNMLVFARCKNVRIEGLTVTGATYWTTHFADCDGVIVRNIRIQNNPTYPNNDGIHFTTCRNVLVEKCRIVAGDDAISITGINQPAGEAEIALGLSGISAVSENIEVKDCYLSSRSAGVRIGFGNNPLRHVVLRNLEIVNSNRGIAIFARQADVDDVTVENCRIQTSLFHGDWWGRGEPIHISSAAFPGETAVFHIRNVVFKDIEAIGENAVTLYAEQEGAIDRVQMIRVRHKLKKGDLFDTWGGNLDLRPANSKIAMHAGGTAPLWAIGVTNFEQTDTEWSLDSSSGDVFAAEPVIRSA